MIHLHTFSNDPVSLSSNNTALSSSSLSAEPEISSYSLALALLSSTSTNGLSESVNAS
jgi:hypothetical protein